MLRWRLPLSIVLVALLAGMCWLDTHATPPGLVLALTATVVAGAAAAEIVRMARAIGADPVLNSCILGAALPSAFCAWAIRLNATAPNTGLLTWLLAGVFVGITLVFATEMTRVLGHGKSLVNLGFSLLAVVYAGGLIAVLPCLRKDHGIFALASLIVLVKSSDIGQYAFGRMWGRRKLAPRLSPGKTWEGAVGGVVVAAVMGAWGLRMGGATAPLAGPAIFGLFLACAGIFGDLAESLLKREAGVKDSSTWLPGFGGVLDVMDSLLFAAPLAYLYWQSGWVGR